jgi:hypothetical protein
VKTTWEPGFRNLWSCGETTMPMVIRSLSPFPRSFSRAPLQYSDPTDIHAPPLADGTDGHIVRNNAPDVTILAIASADFIRRRHDGGPYGGGCPLRNALPLEGRLAFGGELLVDLLDHALQAAGVHVAAQLGVDAAWMDGRRANAAPAKALVEGHSEENVRGL